jgi:hypothetical protein
MDLPISSKIRIIVVDPGNPIPLDFQFDILRSSFDVIATPPNLQSLGSNGLTLIDFMPVRTKKERCQQQLKEARIICHG